MDTVRYIGFKFFWRTVDLHDVSWTILIHKSAEGFVPEWTKSSSHYVAIFVHPDYYVVPNRLRLARGAHDALYPFKVLLPICGERFEQSVLSTIFLYEHFKNLFV